MYRLDCDFCEEVVRSQHADAIKSRAKTHLSENHADDVLAVASDKYDEVYCDDDCGYAVSIDGTDPTEAECPRCGHDNFSALAERYAYWQITEQ